MIHGGDSGAPVFTPRIRPGGCRFEGQSQFSAERLRGQPHAKCYTFCIAMRFEWDDEKNRINRHRHDGLTFETAAKVFNDPLVIFREDRIVEGEQRWHASGGMPLDLLWAPYC
jgi:hypothetical protein